MCWQYVIGPLWHHWLFEAKLLQDIFLDLCRLRWILTQVLSALDWWQSMHPSALMRVALFIPMLILGFWLWSARAVASRIYQLCSCGILSIVNSNSTLVHQLKSFNDDIDHIQPLFVGASRVGQLSSGSSACMTFRTDIAKMLQRSVYSIG